MMPGIDIYDKKQKGQSLHESCSFNRSVSVKVIYMIKLCFF